MPERDGIEWATRLGICPVRHLRGRQVVPTAPLRLGGLGHFDTLDGPTGTPGRVQEMPFSGTNVDQSTRAPRKDPHPPGADHPMEPGDHRTPARDARLVQAGRVQVCQFRGRRQARQGDDPACGADDQAAIHPVAVRSLECVLPTDEAGSVDVGAHEP